MKYVLLIRKETILKLFLVAILFFGAVYWLNINLMQKNIPAADAPQSIVDTQQEIEFAEFLLENGITSELNKDKQTE